MGSLDAEKGLEIRTGGGTHGPALPFPTLPFASYLFPVPFLTATSTPRTSSSYLCTLDLSWCQDCHAGP